MSSSQHTNKDHQPDPESSDAPTPPHLDALRTEIRSVQEQLAFTDHTSDQLSDELLRAFQAIKSLTSRLDRVEARLGEVLSSVEEHIANTEDARDPLDGIELPPHSMGDRADRIRDAENPS